MAILFATYTSAAVDDTNETQPPEDNLNDKAGAMQDPQLDDLAI
jgi:hypothetical protein